MAGEEDFTKSAESRVEGTQGQEATLSSAHAFDGDVNGGYKDALSKGVFRTDGSGNEGLPEMTLSDAKTVGDATETRSANPSENSYATSPPPGGRTWQVFPDGTVRILPRPTPRPQPSPR